MERMRIVESVVQLLEEEQEEMRRRRGKEEQVEGVKELWRCLAEVKQGLEFHWMSLNDPSSTEVTR